MGSLHEYIEELEAEIEESSNAFLSKKKIVDADILFEIIADIKNELPEEVKQAGLIVREKERILSDAQKEADFLLQDTDKKIKEMIDQHEITQKAYEQAEEIVANAQNNAREIREGAAQYADDVLGDIAKYLSEYIDLVSQNRKELHK